MARSYDRLLKHIPYLKNMLERDDTEGLLALYKNVSHVFMSYTWQCSFAYEAPKLRKGSDGARGDDAAQLKKVVVSWIDEIFGPSKPALKPRSKDERGFGNDFTGRLLCPGEFDWDDETYVPSP